MGLQFFKRANSAQTAINADTIASLSRSQAFIEFEPDGTIITANDNFLSVMGYDLDEVAGRHHSMFLESGYSNSPEYRDFWTKLAGGEFQRARFKRLGKGGKEVWIEASYNPLIGSDGKVYRIIKVASDVTERHQESADARGQINAISRSQAVIEFKLDGTILTANENFCSALGYRLEEIRGQHHRLFVTPEEASGPEYQEFWRKLSSGELWSGEYKRIGKGGREVWIQASYNPIFDASGRPYKVVKYATDITARKAAVNELSHVLELLAQGNLNCSIDGEFPGELEQVRLAFNETVDRFGTIVLELRETSSALRAATGEILAGANDLAERTTRQAAAIEETSAAVEQLSQAVTANAQRAESARTNAKSVSEGAIEAGDVMGEANLAMEDVTTQASKISNIIGMIDDIAFQTNLLALNASVEAARAGDAGKGFAVVAVEVRRLAQSAAAASSDVKGLIEQSSEAVAKGSKLVSSAAERLGSMVSRVRENAELMEQIARANGEQASAISEVNTAVRQMDEMTQHNAALVEETNAAIEQTEGQASRVDSLIDVFVVGRSVESAGKSKLSVVEKPAKKQAPRIYISHGSAAMAADWDEF
ncbi:methyl-accepting chemotaxis protein [Devosia sediminis]|uniref:PAS domain S-box protein n=1 Tax=Devosia sediminis TaxID=2798801 RepID=A0A934MNS5_9HYPH|nr:methyl-accepting chemotaxis protein [Devosia sediminis]MBJ3787096.1 PAS domain S-box protein [Devosia sediminis]